MVCLLQKYSLLLTKLEKEELCETVNGWKGREGTVLAEREVAEEGWGEL